MWRTPWLYKKNNTHVKHNHVIFMETVKVSIGEKNPVYRFNGSL